MDFRLYYKAHIYDIGYNNGFDREPNRTPNDEVDKAIIKNYISLYKVSKEDKKIIDSFGLINIEWEEWEE